MSSDAVRSLFTGWPSDASWHTCQVTMLSTLSMGWSCATMHAQAPGHTPQNNAAAHTSSHMRSITMATEQGQCSTMTQSTELRTVQLRYAPSYKTVGLLDIDSVREELARRARAQDTRSISSEASVRAVHASLKDGPRMRERPSASADRTSHGLDHKIWSVAALCRRCRTCET